MDISCYGVKRHIAYEMRDGIETEHIIDRTKSGRLSMFIPRISDYPYNNILYTLTGIKFRERENMLIGIEGVGKDTTIVMSDYFKGLNYNSLNHRNAGLTLILDDKLDIQDYQGVIMMNVDITKLSDTKSRFFYARVEYLDNIIDKDNKRHSRNILNAIPRVKYRTKGFISNYNLDEEEVSLKKVHLYNQLSDLSILDTHKFITKKAYIRNADTQYQLSYLEDAHFNLNLIWYLYKYHNDSELENLVQRLYNYIGSKNV